MLMGIIWLVVGLALILWGANMLTDGSSAIALRMGVSDLVVGLTIVAFGTSAPELVISLISGISGSAGLAIGNVVGSNIFNVLVIVGATALLSPIKVDKGIMTNEIPLVILASLALFVIGSSSYLGGGAPVISRVDGILLLLFFAVFMRYIFSQTKNSNSQEGEIKEENLMAIWKAIAFTLIGLGALVFGGDRFVAGASAIAAGLGVSQAVIGLTIVAAGTSLPELATSVVAAIKGRPGLAVGNVVGSCIFNIFMILGLTATITPLPFSGIGMVDLLVLLGSAILFWIVGWFFRERTIARWEGAVMVAFYVAFTAWLVSKA